MQLKLDKYIIFTSKLKNLTYSLRTSETSYLHESFTFYDAIRNRKYFEGLTYENNSDLYLKKLRYYARFIIVCLFLNKKEMVKTLRNELELYVKKYEDHFNIYSQEWKLCLYELDQFQAQNNTLKVGESLDLIDYKINLITKDKNNISEFIIIGNSEKQTKFSELYLDMYRIFTNLQTFDKKDPKKTLLYRPRFGEVYNALSSIMNEMNTNSDFIGLYLTCNSTKNGINLGDDLLTIEDLVPFTRRPLFLIVESDNSIVMNPKSNKFSKPLVCLLSNSKHQGIMTLFLTNPLYGYCCLKKKYELDFNDYTNFYKKIDTELYKLIEDLRKLDTSFDFFLDNSFTRCYILRFIFYNYVLKCLNFEEFPIIYPKIPEEIYEHKILVDLYKSL